MSKKTTLPRAIIATDGYKLDHRRQYPTGTTYVESNITPRSSRNGDDSMVFFGLQAFLRRWMMEEFDEFFAADVDEVCAAYAERVNTYLGPNQIGTAHIRALHTLGYVPLEFRALPEGTRVPLRVPALVVANTRPEFFWLVNYIETLLSAELWLSCTSASTADRYRTILDEAAKKTGGDAAFVPFQAHDFSMRGMANIEAASISGAAHLLSFVGTDTLPALDYVEKYYAEEESTRETELVGASVAATEHSVMCAGGADDELATFERLLDLYPAGIVSVVSDTWDLWRVLTEFLPQLRDRVLARDGKLVIRPDSGDPADILCGDPTAPAGSPQRRGVIQMLWDVFGGSVNSAGFRELDPHIGAIYGDSITLERCADIVNRLAADGFASTNVVFGVGSYTYQYVTRDTYGLAMKATYAVVDGVGRDLFKDPVTDSGMKRSARGRVAVREVSGVLTLFDEQDAAGVADSLIAPVWRDGEFVANPEAFSEVRRRLADQRNRL